MSYDHAKTRELLSIARAYASHPLGEFVAQLSTQLFDAEAEISALVKGTADMRAVEEEANRRLMSESQAHRTTKENAQVTSAALTQQISVLSEALTKITQDARGAKAVATEALGKLNAAPADVKS